jgi:hypothetical protein
MHMERRFRLVGLLVRGGLRIVLGPPHGQAVLLAHAGSEVQPQQQPALFKAAQRP